jgi:hypothetical protein
MLELLFFIKPSEVEIFPDFCPIGWLGCGIEVIYHHQKQNWMPQRSLATNLRLTHQFNFISVEG